MERQFFDGFNNIVEGYWDRRYPFNPIVSINERGREAVESQPVSVGNIGSTRQAVVGYIKGRDLVSRDLENQNCPFVELLRMGLEFIQLLTTQAGIVSRDQQNPFRFAIGFKQSRHIASLRSEIGSYHGYTADPAKPIENVKVPSNASAQLPRTSTCDTHAHR